VTRFRLGDEVYGSFPHTCADYAAVPEEKVERIPTNLPIEKAAAVPTSGIAALHGIRDAGKVRPGQKVLINGASGGNLDLVRSIGADYVIDYTREDFTRGERRYDLILDQVANHSLSDCRRALTPRGIHVPNSGHGGMSYVLRALVVSMFVRRQGGAYMATPKPGDLVELTEWIEAGKVTPVIDRTYPLGEIGHAFRYLDEGHARGKVVIAVHE